MVIDLLSGRLIKPEMPLTGSCSTFDQRATLLTMLSANASSNTQKDEDQPPHLPYFEELKLSIFEYIEGSCNSKRPHASLNYMTPNEMKTAYWEGIHSFNLPCAQPPQFSDNYPM